MVRCSRREFEQILDHAIMKKAPMPSTMLAASHDILISALDTIPQSTRSRLLYKRTLENARRPQMDIRTTLEFVGNKVNVLNLAIQFGIIDFGYLEMWSPV